MQVTLFQRFLLPISSSLNAPAAMFDELFRAPASPDPARL
jgi:hypothetical protein